MARITAEARADNRARLLEAAAEAFARDGLEGANINKISLAAGLAKGTVYNHFPSKEALFVAVVEEANARALADVQEMGAQAPTRDRLRAILAAGVAWAQNHEAFARVLVREIFAGRPELYGRLLAASVPYFERVAHILHDGVTRGEVRADMPANQLALVFTGMGDLALVQHWGSGGQWPTLGEIPDLVVDLFLDGARPDRAQR